MKRLLTFITVGLALLLTMGSMHSPPVISSKDHVAVLTPVSVDNYFNAAQDLVLTRAASTNERHAILNVEPSAVTLLDSRSIETSRQKSEVRLAHYFNYIDGDLNSSTGSTSTNHATTNALL